MMSAMGMVMLTVNAPHGELLSAFTTMSAQVPSNTTMMAMMAMKATTPPTGPTSSRVIWQSDLPSRRTLNESVTKSCTHPEDRADDDPKCARQISELRGHDWTH